MFSHTTCGVVPLKLGMKSMFLKGVICAATEVVICYISYQFAFFKMETEEVYLLTVCLKLMQFLLRDLQMAYFNMTFQLRLSYLLSLYFLLH